MKNIRLKLACAIGCCICQLTACSYLPGNQYLGKPATNLPRIVIPSQVTVPPHLCQSPPNALQDWQYALQLVDFFYGQAYQVLNMATRRFYPLVDVERRSLIVPLIENCEVKRVIISCAIQAKIFQYHKLTPQQVEDMHLGWRELLKAEKYFLYAAILVADLRNQWPQWLYFPYVPEYRLWNNSNQDEQYRHIAAALQNSPTVELIREKHYQTQLLLEACRQLIAENPTLLPPLPVP